MDWIANESKTVYKEYIELLSNGVTAFHVKDKQVSVGSVMISLPAYTDVDQELNVLYNERRSLALEYTFLCKQIIYGRRGIDLKERYDFCIKRLNILNREISRLLSYKELLDQKQEVVKDKLENKRDALVLMLESSKSSKEYLKVHAKLHVLYAKMHKLNKGTNYNLPTKLPVIHTANIEVVREEPEKKKAKTRKRREKTALAGGSPTPSSLVNTVKTILKHKFGSSCNHNKN